LEALIDGRGLLFPQAVEPAPAPAPPPPFVIPRPDWEAERLERLEREGATEVVPEHDVSSNGANVEPQPEAYPAPKTKKPKRTPRLDKVRAWLKEDGR